MTFSLVPNCIAKIAYKRQLFPEKCFILKDTISFKKGSHPGVDKLMARLATLQTHSDYIYSLTLGIVKNHEIKESWTFDLLNEEIIEGNWEQELDEVCVNDPASLIVQVQYTLECPDDFTIDGFKECVPIVALEEKLGCEGSVLISFWQDNDMSDIKTEFSCSTTDSRMIPASQLVGADPFKFSCICNLVEEPSRQLLVICVYIGTMP